MRVVVQRALDAKCLVNEENVGSIDKGFMLLVGFTHHDTMKEVKALTKKIVGLRIFEDEQGKMNKSIHDINGEILAISQFTLYADAKHGNRPSFTEAMAYEQANLLFSQFIEELKTYIPKVQTGVFGADMKISFVNDGPVTILLDSQELL
ncbi:MAG: D-tyrosyl-tRNA(Tyr) deacylase [Anaeroplasmataceae bacterium]|jgi:D-tyrosyl-tRNA(Tyr) deacylase|nr:D-tyrosyl-tRNA(Tyr) deacylase [Anaeroplasmataceae bacterium]